MNRAEIKKRMLANWDKAGKPVCKVCRRPVYGVPNMRDWKTNGNLCPGCMIDSVNAQDSKYASIPPLGIRHEG